MSGLIGIPKVSENILNYHNVGDNFLSARLGGYEVGRALEAIGCWEKRRRRDAEGNLSFGEREREERRNGEGQSR